MEIRPNRGSGPLETQKLGVTDGIGDLFRKSPIPSVGRGASSASEAPGSRKNVVLEDQLIRVYRQGTRTGPNGKSFPGIKMDILDPQQLEVVTTREALLRKLSDSFASHGGATIYLNKDRPSVATAVKVPGRMVDGKFVRRDPQEYAAEIVNFIDGEGMELFIANEPCVVPMRSLWLATSLAEKIEESRFSYRSQVPEGLNPDRYEAGSLGMRLHRAISNRMRDARPEGVARNIGLGSVSGATADKSSRFAFSKDAWRAVSDEKLNDIFKSRGIEFQHQEVPFWSQASVTIRAFGEGDDKVDLVVRSEDASPDQAFPPQVEFLQKAHQAYMEEMRKTGIAIMEEMHKAVVAAIEKPAIKEEDDGPRMGM